MCYKNKVLHKCLKIKENAFYNNSQVQKIKQFFT